MSKRTRYVQLMLRPIARYCLRQSMGLHDIIEAAKIALVQVAEEELDAKGIKVTLSRLSAASGVHRKDTTRIHREGGAVTSMTRLTGKVITQWREDKEFLTPGRRPRVLTYKGKDNEFTRLVQKISQDIKPGTVLFDLERIEAIKKTENGLKLIARTYIPRSNQGEAFRLLSQDSEDLYEAVLANIDADSMGEQVPNYHAKASFDNIDKKDVPRLRKWLFKQSSLFHARAMRHISKYDLDLNPDPEKDGGERIALGIFTRT